jgi:hypothetical protein
MALQEKWGKMYLSEYIYNKIIDSKGNHINIDPMIPLPNTVSEIFADLLFLEFPDLQFNDKEEDELLEDVKTKLSTELLEYAALASAQGMIWWYLFIKNDKVYWKFIQPQHTVWEHDSTGDLSMWRVFKAVGEEKDHEQTYKVLEYEKIKNEDGEVSAVIMSEYEITVNVTTMEVTQVAGLEEETFLHNFIPAILIENMGLGGTDIGKSDYLGKEQLFAEIDHRVDQINDVLHNHAEPWTFLPSGMLDSNGDLNRANGKWVEKAPGGQADNSVEFSTWDASLDASFRQIEMMIRQIFFTSRISAPIAGLEQGGAVESGRALKWRSVNTFAAVSRRRIYWGKALKLFFMMLGEMDKGYKAIKDAKITIGWKDGLPLDEQGVIDTAVQAVNAQIMSKLTAIENTQEKSTTEAQEELDQINKEQRDDAEIESTAQAPITF